MAGYKPLKITGYQTGLVQSRENFLLPNDAYPTLQNAYVWRERIKRKQGYKTLGRLQRSLSAQALGNSSGAGGFTGNIISILSLESTANFNPVGFSVSDGGNKFTDTTPPTGVLSGSIAGSGTINYATGDLFIANGSTTPNSPITTTFSYYPGLPVMGLRLREDTNATFFQTVAFDQVYAYSYNGTNWQEFIPGTTWNANGGDVTGINFFWTTNYWIGNGNSKIFWALNSPVNPSNESGDPIRYTNGTAWIDFAPNIDAASPTPNSLYQATCMVPFRGRLVAFNTWEGTTFNSSVNYSNRIRWAAIGTPFTITSAIVASSNINAKAWRDDIRGQGGFLDIPTSEDIVSVGFVRDNLVIYCERSTWQLRYTGRSISPFQIEKVNSENGAQSTFSSIQFDTSLVAIGDKGILECDSYKAELIDIKIPDFVFQLNSANNGTLRVQGVRDFKKRLAYWTVPIQPNGIYPDQRLVYNYENDSWALFNDSLTALGTIQIPTSPTWLNTSVPWIQCNFPWISDPVQDPEIIGGNQQGYTFYLDQLTVNAPSLCIEAFSASATNQTIVTSPYHNMQTGFVIGISGIPNGTSYANLNGGVYGIIVLDNNRFIISTFNSENNQFDVDVPFVSGTYVGIGQINIRENFTITSKKFNYLDEGQSIQIGYFDILMDSTGSDNPGAISLNVFADYNDQQTTNTLPQNAYSDTFFNSVIPTTAAQGLNTIGGTKFWQRVICPTRANFITLQYLFSNAQMAGTEQELDVQIDAQVLWLRQGGRMTNF